MEKVCVICCSQKCHSSDSKLKFRNSLEDHGNLSKFCDAINLPNGNQCDIELNRVWKNDLFIDLQLFQDITVCEDCLDFISLAVATKEKIGELENLLRQVREELRDQRSNLFEDMWRIGETVRNSEKSTLQSRLEKMPIPGQWNINRFREKIESVIQYLGFKHEDNKLPLIRNRIAPEVLSDVTKAESGKETCYSESGPLFLAEETPSTSGTGIQNEEENEDQTPANHGDISVSSDDLQNQAPLSQQSTFEECGFPTTVDPNPPGVGPSSELATIPHPPKVHADTIFYLPPSGPEEVKKIAYQYLQFMSTAAESLKSMPQWKQYVYLRIEKRAENILINQDREFPEKNDPRNRYFFGWNRHTNNLAVGGVDFIMDEKADTVTCSWCDFGINELAVSKYFKVENVLHDHIIGCHLKLYECRACSMNFNTYGSYLKHLTSHRDECLWWKRGFKISGGLCSVHKKVCKSSAMSPEVEVTPTPFLTDKNDVSLSLPSPHPDPHPPPSIIFVPSETLTVLHQPQPPETLLQSESANGSPEFIIEDANGNNDALWELL